MVSLTRMDVRVRPTELCGTSLIDIENIYNIPFGRVIQPEQARARPSSHHDRGSHTSNTPMIAVFLNERREPGRRDLL